MEFQLDIINMPKLFSKNFFLQNAANNGAREEKTDSVLRCHFNREYNKPKTLNTLYEKYPFMILSPFYPD